MNLILFSQHDLVENDRIRLEDDRYQQILHVHQSKVGDTVRIGKLNGQMGTGTIESISNDSLELSYTLDQVPPAKLPLTVILALPRPKMIRRIFRSCAELGIDKLIVINSFKVDKSYWGSPMLADEKVQEFLIEGLQQARDTVIPDVSFRKLFKPFVEDELPAILKDPARIDCPS